MEASAEHERELRLELTRAEREKFLTSAPLILAYPRLRKGSFVTANSKYLRDEE